MVRHGRVLATAKAMSVVVTGVDTRTDMVHLNDSGIPTGSDEQISIAAFTQAWATSNDVTLRAAPNIATCRQGSPSRAVS